jgi:nucleoside 2-deoxyribosyltransferase
MLSKNGYYTKINFIDPISYFNYTNKKPKTDKQCLELFIWQIDKCDILLLNLDHSNKSCGSCMEVEHAHCNNIPIIAFGEKPETWYNWAATRSTAILESLDLAIDYIYDNYVKGVF